MFTSAASQLMAGWVFDPRRRHVPPADDDAARLSLPEADLAALAPVSRAPARATVTPGSRLAAAPPPARRPPPRNGGPNPARGEPGPRRRSAPAEAHQARTAETRQARTAEAQVPRAAEARSPRVAEAHSPRAAEPRPAPRRPARRPGRGDSARGREPGAAGAAARPGPQGRRGPVPPRVRAVLGSNHVRHVTPARVTWPAWIYPGRPGLPATILA